MGTAPIVLARGLGAHLDDLLTSRFLPTHFTQRIWSAQELPKRLQRRVSRLKPDAEWRAYSDDERIFCAIARLHASAARECGMALDVYFLDREGAVYSAAVWANNAKQGWWLDAVLDASYDCDQGWWFEALMDTRPPTDVDLVPPPAPPPVFATVVASLSAPPACGRKSRL